MMSGKKGKKQAHDDDSEEGGPVMIDTTGKGKRRNWEKKERKGGKIQEIVLV